MVSPNSSKSALVIHMEPKVERVERVDPPLQTMYFLSGEAMTFTFIVAGASPFISLYSHSPKPSNMVVPPDRITFP